VSREKGGVAWVPENELSVESDVVLQSSFEVDDGTIDR
jgi:hypothetical protein